MRNICQWRLAFRIQYVLLILAIPFASCTYDYNNPSDPRSDNYQNFDVVADVDDVVPVKLPEIEYEIIPLLSVAKCVNASAYWIQISSSETDFFDPLFENDGYVSNESMDISMADLTEGIWYWRVCARESSTGDWGSWSVVSSFSARAPEFTGFTPADGSSTNDTTPLLDWEDFPGASGYEVQYALSDGDLHGAQRETVADSQYSVPQGEAFAFGETCRWRVRAIMTDGNRSVWSRTMSVFFDKNAVWSGIEPADGSSTSDTTPLLNWADIDWAESYEVQISSSEEGITESDVRIVSDSEYQVPIEDVFSFGETLYWRLKAINPDGAGGDWSAVYEVSIDGTVAWSGFDPADSGNTNDSTPLLDWADVGWANHYEVQFASTEGVVAASDPRTAAASEYQIPDADEFSYGGTGYWRVRAVNEDGICSDWSEISGFGIVLSAGSRDPFLSADIEFNLIYVPAESFFTGTDDSGSSSVALSFWISETEVTYELWYAVRTWAESGSGSATGEGDYSFANDGKEGSYGSAGAAPTAASQEPVVNVNWRDAMIWCNALTEWFNAQAGTSLACVYYSDSGYTTPIRTSTNSTTITYTTNGSQDAPYVNPDADGFRLPANMEWDLAARFIEDANDDGDIKDSGEYYPGNYASGAAASISNQSATENVAWFGQNSGNKTHAAKGKAADALGLFDMSGNVWEMCFDWHPSYIGTYRVHRGASFLSDISNLDLGRLSGREPYYQYTGDFGFRIARNAD